MNQSRKSGAFLFSRHVPDFGDFPDVSAKQNIRSSGIFLTYENRDFLKCVRLFPVPVWVYENQALK